MFVFTPAPIRKQEPRFVDEPSNNASWLALHAVADSAYFPLRRLWLETIETAASRISVRAMQAALEAGSEIQVAGIITRIWQEVIEEELTGPLGGVFMDTMARAAEVSVPSTESVLQRVTPDARLTVSIGPTDPRTIQYIRQYAGTQIREISETTLQNVREVLARGFAERRTTAQMARDLKEFIGLTVRQGQTLENYRQGLIEAGTKTRRMAELVERRKNRMIRQRVQNVARTEGIDIASAANQRVWEAADEQGLWDPRFRRFWVITPRDACPQCRRIPVMNPNGVQLREPFQTPYGPLLHPTAHPL